jgi:hypothetical protein
MAAGRGPRGSARPGSGTAALAAPAAFLDPARYLRLVGARGDKQFGGAAAECLVDRTLAEADEQASLLGEQVGSARGEYAQLGDGESGLRTGKFAPARVMLGEAVQLRREKPVTGRRPWPRESAHMFEL